MRMEEQAYGLPYWCLDVSATAGVATATQAAVATKRHVITGIVVSASGDVAAATTLALTDVLGADTDSLGTIAVQAGRLAPIVLLFPRPLVTRTGAAFNAVLGSLGGGIVGRVVVYGYTVSD